MHDSEAAQGLLETFLLGSCGRRDTCGTYKDQGFKKTQRSYECADLVNPSIHDPDDFFIFRESGRVEPRRGLNEADAARAHLTIDVLNLNQDASKQRYICAIRERALRSYKDLRLDANWATFKVVLSLAIEGLQ